MTRSIRFDDGAAYQRYMGLWSEPAGDAFLAWLAPPYRVRWLDVGCGNGAFTERILARTAPSSVHGIDPSAAQLEFARTRAVLGSVHFRQGDAMALPYTDDQFDAAVMPLVIFFVPEPAKGVSEMVRVVAPGGVVAAYAWDMENGGFPYAALQAELRALGATLPVPPSPEASRVDVLRELWTAAGLEDVATHEITVQRTFADFDDYWATIQLGPSVGPTLAELSAEDRAVLNERLREHLPADADGRIKYRARANAVRGRVPTSHVG